MATFLPTPGDNRMASIVADIAERGWSWQPHLLPDSLLGGLRQEITELDAAADLAPAGIGRDEAFLVDHSIRKTRITWLDGTTPPQVEFMQWAEQIREALNRSLLLGLFEFEACFAVYPEGGFYERHLDSFEGARNRVVSMVVYLNADWRASDGGAFVVWPEGAGETAEPAARLIPEGGGVVLMLSETVPHAVEVTHKTRYGIAAWWRVNPSIDGRTPPLE